MAAVVLLLSWPSGPAAAQEEGAIVGREVDSPSLQPLGGAQVFLRDLEPGTLSGDDGSFRITGVPAGERRVGARGLRPGPRRVPGRQRRSRRATALTMSTRKVSTT